MSELQLTYRIERTSVPTASILSICNHSLPINSVNSSASPGHTVPSKVKAEDHDWLGIDPTSVEAYLMMWLAGWPRP